MDGVSLELQKLSFERFRKQLNKTPEPMASSVFVKRGLILVLQKQIVPPGWGSFMLLFSARILGLFEKGIILRPAPGGVADFSCKPKFKTTESLEDIRSGFL